MKGSILSVLRRSLSKCTERRFLQFIIVIVLLACSLGWWRYKKSTHKSEFYTASKQIVKDLTYYVTATGTLSAQTEITVGSLVAGRVVSLHADDNDEVKKGDLLLVIDDGILDAPIKQLTALICEKEADYAYQKAFYLRQKELFKAGQLSRNALDMQQSLMRMAKARIDQAIAQRDVESQRYENLFVRSPEAGTVISRKVDVGQTVTAQFAAMELFVIAKDLNHMEADLEVDEADVGVVLPGQEATFTVDAFPHKVFHATVKQVNYGAKVVDNVTTYKTVLRISNEKRLLRPGMTTNAIIKTQEAKEALCVPNRALRINGAALKIQAEKHGYAVQELPTKDGQREVESLWVVKERSFIQKEITTGITDRRYTQICHGTSKNDLVLFDVEEVPQENLLLKQAFGSAGVGRK